MSEVRNYRDLIAWQKAMDLVEAIYEASASFPKEETYGLQSQLRRASVSVPSNLAEGSSKKSKKEFVRFCNIAYGSLAEVETQILIAERLDYIDGNKADQIMTATNEIAKIISGLLRSLKEPTDNVTQLSTLTTQN